MPDDNEYRIRLKTPDGFVDATVLLHDEAPGSDSLSMIELFSPLVNLTVTGDHGYFHLFKDLRRQLERVGAFPECAGGAINAIQSGMGAQMGDGGMIWLAEIGKRTAMNELLYFLDVPQALKLGTVAETEAFHEAWLTSVIGKRV
jgi:hypothetical protein